jgi:hypothetical protein
MRGFVQGADRQQTTLFITDIDRLGAKIKKSAQNFDTAK